MTAVSDGRIFARFWPATKPIRRQLCLSLVLVVIAPVLSAGAIWMFKIVIDRMVVPHDFRLFPELAAAYLGLAVPRGIVRFADQYVSTGASERFVLELRSTLFSHLHRLSPAFFDNRPLGDLLSRLTSDISAGWIAVDGIGLRHLALSDLYRNVATVPQETLVFDGTVSDNIRWGNPEATDREVVAAAVAADAHTFIQALPDGYQTRIGQRGRKLSGGQRQRLAIARAMIRDAPVLLLDEPTTGLDAESTHRVLAPLRRLMAGRTTITISHNLLTVTDADRIIYLENGRITAVGTHTELLRDSPGYAQLYRLHQPDPELADHQAACRLVSPG